MERGERTCMYDAGFGLGPQKWRQAFEGPKEILRVLRLPKKTWSPWNLKINLLRWFWGEYISFGEGFGNKFKQFIL